MTNQHRPEPEPMDNWPFPPATYIDTDRRLAALAESLRSEALLGIDTESNSMHAYRERVCLVQLSTRTHDYIIDPLPITDMTPLGMLLQDPAIRKVFHAAEYDLMCLKRDYGFTVHNLFDTMLAARICGYKAFGLNNLLAENLNITLDKSHQRDNWGVRPLPDDSLRYAQMDTHYLPQLHDILVEALAQGGHLEEAEETFAEVSTSTPAHDGRTFDPDGFWKIGLPHQLTQQQYGLLRELYLLREKLAEQRDLPPFKVFNNNVLVAIARANPQNHHELRRISGMSAGQVRRYGDDLLAALARGRGAQLSPPPQHRPPPQALTDLYTLLHTWRKERAQQRGVESDVIISRQALWALASRALAQDAPLTPADMAEIQGMGPWRLNAYGHELAQVIAGFVNGK